MTSTNILKSILNIKNLRTYNLTEIYSGLTQNSSYNNRINSVGEALEVFIKDSFCNSFNEQDTKKKKEIYREHFSYLGNQNNPPDLIIRKGDSVEVKKIDGVRFSDLALNSSYPKAKLLSSSPMITTACRNCEPNWIEKDIIYAVGNIEKDNLRVLTFIYGDCYAASEEVYLKIKNSISEGIENLNLELSQTKELARVNRVDPLGITNLRIRGMWTIQNPLKLYSRLIEIQEKEFQFFIILRKEKFDSFPKQDIDSLNLDLEISIEDISIDDPDNPAKKLEVKLISYRK